MSTATKATKTELMEWHRQCIRRGLYKTAQLIMSGLLRVLPTQHMAGGYLVYIASYDKEVHDSGFAQYIKDHYEDHVNVHGEKSYQHSDSGAICTRLIRKAA